jgi:hypothetical protein
MCRRVRDCGESPLSVQRRPAILSTTAIPFCSGRSAQPRANNHHSFLLCSLREQPPFLFALFAARTTAGLIPSLSHCPHHPRTFHHNLGKLGVVPGRWRGKRLSLRAGVTTGRFMGVKLEVVWPASKGWGQHVAGNKQRGCSGGTEPAKSWLFHFAVVPKARSRERWNRANEYDGRSFLGMCRRHNTIGRNAAMLALREDGQKSPASLVVRRRGTVVASRS